MKVWESEHVFDHPWATVCQAAWRKYPNPINPVVSGIDILERKVDGDGIMRTTRLLQTQWRIPSWATSLIGLQNPSLALEYSEVDPVAKTMTLRSRNLTCSCFVTIDESLVYRPHPDNANRTLLEQSAIIRVCGVPLIDRMESIVVSSVNSNASRGRQAMDWVINCIKVCVVLGLRNLVLLSFCCELINVFLYFFVMDTVCQLTYFCFLARI